MRAFLFAFTLILSGCASQPDYRAEEALPETVASVELDRYLGKWYEIARYPNSFERNCQGVTAEYSIRPDGNIGVLNTCRADTPDGKARTAEGRARIVEGSNNSKLRVKFAPVWVPFAEGDYWILHLEADYSAALVGDPSGKYLWILGREKALEPYVLAKIKDRADALGYDVSKLEMVAQQ